MKAIIVTSTARNSSSAMKSRQCQRWQLRIAGSEQSGQATVGLLRGNYTGSTQILSPEQKLPYSMGKGRPAFQEVSGEWILDPSLIAFVSTVLLHVLQVASNSDL